MNLDRFKKKLLSRLSELEELTSIGNEAAMPVELDQTRVGRISRMDAMQAQAMSIEAKRRRELELNKVNSALQRIEEGSYGECIRCHEPIAEGRLEFDPSTLLCINCAEESMQ